MSTAEYKSNRLKGCFKRCAAATAAGIASKDEAGTSARAEAACLSTHQAGDCTKWSAPCEIVAITFA